MTTIHPSTPSIPSTHTPITIEEADNTTQNIRIDLILQMLKTWPTISPSMITSLQTLQTTKTTHTKAPLPSSIGRNPPPDKALNPPPSNLKGGSRGGGSWGSGSSEGSGGSGGSGGEEGRGGRGRQPAAAPNPSDVKVMGQLPPVFNGDWTKLEEFIELLKAYFCLNHQVSALQSFLTRIALALILIQGPNVSEWTRTTRDWLNRLTPLDDKFDTWDQFANQFLAAFMDTQRNQKAQTELQNLWMKWPLIDQYTMDFERLVWEAGYQSGTPECIHMFVSGLPIEVATNIMRSPLAQTYQEVVQRVIDSIKSKTLLDIKVKNRGFPPCNNCPNNWQIITQRTPPRPFKR